MESIEQPDQSRPSRPHRRQREERKPSSDTTSLASPPLGVSSPRSDYLTPQFLLGLTIAGVASVLLTTIFGLFQVDVFLRVYDIPLSTFATGNFLFSFINTANDLAGAWIVDHIATKSSRSSLIGASGCVFSLCFLTPFFRPQHLSNVLAGTHFVTSLSLYDTMYSFVAILMGSVITDNVGMSDHDRVRFMASGKVVNLVVSFFVARLGLELFEESQTHAMRGFRIFLVMLSILVSILFLVAQFLMNHPHVSMLHDPRSWMQFRIIRWKSGATAAVREHEMEPLSPPYGAPTANPVQATRKRPLKFRQVVRDFWSHSNFSAWIGMEMLLECQNTFVHSFSKTFVDRLVFDAGISRDSCDWLLSVLPSLRQIVGIACYVPIRRFGYRMVYNWLFVFNLVLSVMCLVFVSESSHPYWIAGYMILYKVSTGAVQSAGFHLAMSDMVLEMKRKHAEEERFDEPSLAGLFMGANALLCKPMESFLPIVAAYFLGKTDFSQDQFSPEARQTLFYLLVVPPIAFSCLQLLSWSRYTLHPERTELMRGELQRLHSLRATESTYTL